MADAGLFDITGMRASRGLAVKTKQLAPDGSIISGDHTLLEKWWLMRRLSCPNDPYHVADFLRSWLTRQDVMMIHGAPAPGLNLSLNHPRWSSEDHGVDATIISPEVAYIPFDGEGFHLPEGSELGLGRNLEGLGYYFRDILPAAFRDVELVVRPSSSTGFDPTQGRLHVYALLDRLVPLSVIYRWLKGLRKVLGLPIDPSVALPGQPFISARPVLRGIADPVPERLRAFVLPGLRPYAGDIDWDEHESGLVTFEATERRARAIAAECGWRGALDFLGDDKLRFYEPLRIALGRASLSGAPIEEVVGVLRAAVVAHPDYATRRGQYSEDWLRREYRRFRLKDGRRDARIAEIRGQLIQPGSRAP